MQRLEERLRSGIGVVVCALLAGALFAGCDEVEVRRLPPGARAAFARIPIQEAGRVKPLSTVARYRVLKLRGMLSAKTHEGPLLDASGKVIGIDLLPVDPIPGADLIQMDFMSDEAPDVLKRLLDGRLANVVLSDMAASSTGHSQTDHIKIMALAETAYDFAKDVLAKGGVFICNVLQGGATGELLKLLKRDFTEVKHVKPPASRSDSAEIYVVALGFRG